MMPKILKFDVSFNTADKSREFCYEFSNIFITLNPKGEEDGELISFHDGYKVIGGIDKHIQMQGIQNLIYDKTIVDNSISHDEYIEDDSFILFDPAGGNYIHFFFCLFGKCFYYDQLIKYRNIKLWIPEHLLCSTGKLNYVKQWMSLYYPNITIYPLRRNVKYKFKKLILPNSFYNFPQPFGFDFVYPMIRKVVDKIESLKESISDGVYISRQDTIKRGWYHNRVLVNELDLIEKIKKELKYDIVELMDFDMIGKIKIFKSYKNIIQLHSASVINILFSDPKTNHYIIEHPKMSSWLTPKCKDFARLSKSNIITIEDFGEIVDNLTQPDENNYPWKLNELDFLVENIKNVSKIN